MAIPRQRSRSSTRRKLIWARQPAVDGNIPVGGTTQVDLLANFETLYGAQLIGCTVMRIRGKVSVASAVSAPATSAPLPSVMGILVTNGTVIPGTVAGPIASPYEDWMMYDSAYLSHGSELIAPGLPSLALVEFDVKSMRKIDELQQRLLWVIQNHPGAPLRNFNLTTSVLLALP